MENLQETTTTANVGTADFNFNQVIAAFQQLPTDSLVRNIASVVPMKMSTGSIIALRKQAGGNSFETVQSTLTVNNLAGANPVQSGLSTEALQDLTNQYGESGYEIAANLLKGLMDKEEDASLLAFLNTNALSTPALALSQPTNAETNVFEITQRVQELVTKMNTPDFRTYKAFAILPYKQAGAIAALSKYVKGDDESEDALLVTQIGETKYYVNPDPTATTAYVGLADGKTGASSLIMGDYQRDILMSSFAEAFQPNIGIINRYALAVNPLSVAGQEMLVSFTIS